MKANKIIYWIATIFTAGMFLMSAFMYLSHNPALMSGFQKIGYPAYFVNILGTAKLLGALALLQPWSKPVKEWAYAGFTFILIGALWTHMATGTSFSMVLVVFAALAVSYIFYKKIGTAARPQTAFAGA